MRRNIFLFFSLAVLIGTGSSWPGGDVSAATLMYENDFEGTLGSSQKDGGCYSYSFAMVNTPTRTGSNSLRVINKNDELAGSCRDGKHRAQLDLSRPHRYFFNSTSTKYWIGFSVYIPDNFPTSGYEPGGNTILAQNNAGPGGPEWALYLREGKSLRFQTAQHRQTFGSFAPTKGKWMDFVLYYTRSWTNRGEMKIWVNGDLKYDVTNSNTAHDVPAGRDVGFTLGLYWANSDRPGQVQTAYFDSVKFAEGDDGYALVAPDGQGRGSITTTTDTRILQAPTGLRLSIQ